MSWLQKYFTGNDLNSSQTFNKQKSHDQLTGQTIRVYTDYIAEYYVDIIIKENSIAQDVLKQLQIINKFQETNFQLIIVTHKNDDKKIYRRMNGYEKVYFTKEITIPHVKYYYIINDFNLRKHISNKQKPFIETQISSNFDLIGKLMKKNKRGVYVSSKTYINKEYFGFFNNNKHKMKLFKLETLQLYIWDDGQLYTFKIATPKKIYFFKANDIKDFRIWTKALELHLESTRMSLMFKFYEKSIRDSRLLVCNMMEEVCTVQLKSKSPKDRDREFKLNFLKFLINHCSNSMDLNLAAWGIQAYYILNFHMNPLLQNSQFEYLTEKWKQIRDCYNEEKNNYIDMEVDMPMRKDSKKTRSLVDFEDENEIMKLSEELEIDQGQPIFQNLNQLQQHVFEGLFKKYQSEYLIVLNQDELVHWTMKAFKKSTSFQKPNFNYLWI